MPSGMATLNVEKALLRIHGNVSLAEVYQLNPELFGALGRKPFFQISLRLLDLPIELGLLPSWGHHHQLARLLHGTHQFDVLAY